jgi:GntR family transcriptional repressor for pyruvate dehydrogenase complex
METDGSALRAAGPVNPLPLVHVPRPRLSDSVVAYFSREIVSGRLAPGQALPSEPELAAQFGLSKVVIRDSIQALETMGLIRVQQGKRTIVLNDAEWDVLSSLTQRAFQAEGTARDLREQMYEARLIVEPAVAALCAARSTEARVQELIVLVDQMRLIARRDGDVGHFLAIDRAFHDLIARAVGNVAVRAMMRDLHVPTAAHWANSGVLPADLAMLAEQHARIATAIEARDSEGARRVMAEHIEWARQVDIERFQK